MRFVPEFLVLYASPAPLTGEPRTPRPHSSQPRPAKKTAKMVTHSMMRQAPLRVTLSALGLSYQLLMLISLLEYEWSAKLQAETQPREIWAGARRATLHGLL